MFKCRICDTEHETLEKVINCESNCLKAQEEAKYQAEKNTKENKIKELEKAYEDYSSCARECFQHMLSIQEELSELKDKKPESAFYFPNLIKLFY